MKSVYTLQKGQYDLEEISIEEISKALNNVTLTNKGYRPKYVYLNSQDFRYLKTILSGTELKLATHDYLINDCIVLTLIINNTDLPSKRIMFI